MEQDKDYHQIVVKQETSLVNRTVLGLRVCMSSSMNIYFGVGLESRRNEKYTCQHKASTAYKLSGGKFLFEDSRQSGEEVPKVREGETLTIILNPLKQ